MKKILLLLSITLMTVWIIGFFILKLPSAIHIFPVLSILVYIRSVVFLESTETPKNYETHNDNS